MIWKSAPNGQTLPLMPSPFTSPPVIGMMRRMPEPISPAVVTGPMLAVMVKTYLVSRTGLIRLSNHAHRQPGCQQREQDQDHQPDQVGDHERQHADEDRGHVDVLDHALDHEHVHAYRWMNEPKF